MRGRIFRRVKWFIPTSVLIAWSWIFVENIGQQRHHAECCSSSVSLSLRPSVSCSLCVSVPFGVSVRRRLSVSAALLYVCCMVTLTEASLLFLVLCIALRKCSTPHSAGSSSKGGVSWRRSHSSCTHIQYSLTLSLSLSLPLFLPLLLSAVKLHWTVIAQKRSSVIVEPITPAFVSFSLSIVTYLYLHAGIQISNHDCQTSLHAHVYLVQVLCEKRRMCHVLSKLGPKCSTQTQRQRWWKIKNYPFNYQFMKCAIDD